MLDPGIDRQGVKRALKEQHGVSLSGEVYASPLHEQPVFADLHHGSLPVAEDVCRRHVCLPIHSDMTRDEAAYVVDSVRTVLARPEVKNGTP
jgi:dTDP-4-amino-4,6-dideoxygalactose transaminase